MNLILEYILETGWSHFVHNAQSSIETPQSKSWIEKKKTNFPKYDKDTDTSFILFLCKNINISIKGQAHL